MLTLAHTERNGYIRAMAFDQAKADAICARVATGETLASILPDIGIARTTLHDWRKEHPEFADEFARAKDAGYDAIADDCAKIADDGSRDYVKTDDGLALDRDHIQRSKLRVETRLKLLAKWDPKRYGDRTHVEHSGAIDLAGALTEARTRADKAK